MSPGHPLTLMEEKQLSCKLPVRNGHDECNIGKSFADGTR